MSADDSLDLVIDLATGRRDEAVRVVTEARRVEDAAAAKLALLIRYRSEQRASGERMLDPRPTDSVRIANTRAFVDKLDSAIAQQQREVDAAAARTAAAIKGLQRAEMRLKSLERLRERRDGEARRVENRREQTRTDAFAARAARKGGASLESR